MLIGKLNLFDPDIRKIPEYNYQKFQRCLILDAGIGSTALEVIRHTDTITTLAVNDRREDLVNELNNFRLAIYSAIENINYTSMAFACLVIDIDGEKVNIVTDTDINNLSKRITETGITHDEISEYVELLKKKVNAQLKESFAKEEDITYYDTLYRYAKALSEDALEDNKGETIKTLFNKLLDFNKPKNFIQGDKDNVLLMMDKAYQKTLFALSENNIQNSQNFSMFEFRTAIEMLKERNDKMREDIEKSKQPK